MEKPSLSSHFASRQPSSIRMAQIEFARRTDGVRAVNVAIGNVSLPMHPAMRKRMFGLDSADSPFAKGVVAYTATVGTDEARQAFSNVIAASGCPTENLKVQITDGGSQAMELMIVGLCGEAGSSEKPLLVIDAAYTNYKALADRLGRAVVSVGRKLDAEGRFSLPDLDEIRETVRRTRPGAMVVIPYDNPTGHFYGHGAMVALAKICVEENLWMVSDEAYRELYFDGGRPSSIWAISESEVPGIAGRRVSIESASKVWNACGLRIGALVTDSAEFHGKSVAENTANLCSSAIGQYIFGALAHESHESLQQWFGGQRAYYRDLMVPVVSELKERLPGVVVSKPSAALYSVVDVGPIAAPGFDAAEFVRWCAREGVAEVEGERLTLLVAPMSGFYNVAAGGPNPGRTQMRIAYVETPDRMALVPRLFGTLFRQFETRRRRN